MFLKFNLLSYAAFLFACWLLTPKVYAFTPTQQEACCLEVLHNSTDKVDSVCGSERPSLESCNIVIKQMGDAAKKHRAALDKFAKQTNKITDDSDFQKQREKNKKTKKGFRFKNFFIGASIILALIFIGIRTSGKRKKAKLTPKIQSEPKNIGYVIWPCLVVIAVCSLPSIPVALFGVLPQWRESLILLVMVFLQVLGSILVGILLMLIRSQLKYLIAKRLALGFLIIYAIAFARFVN